MQWPLRQLCSWWWTHGESRGRKKGQRWTWRKVSHWTMTEAMPEEASWEEQRPPSCSVPWPPSKNVTLRRKWPCPEFWVRINRMDGAFLQRGEIRRERRSLRNSLQRMTVFRMGYGDGQTQGHCVYLCVFGMDCGDVKHNSTVEHSRDTFSKQFRVSWHLMEQ